MSGEYRGSGIIIVFSLGFAMFRQELLNKETDMCWCVVLEQKPSSAASKFEYHYLVPLIKSDN